MFVQVRCILATHPNWFLTVSHSCMVISDVEPPAPQVKSVNRGPSSFIRRMRFFKLSTPDSVFGGKYSKENHGFFSAAIISQTILSFAPVDTMAHNYNVSFSSNPKMMAPK